MVLLYISFIVNILVAGYFGMLLVTGGNRRVHAVYGANTPASRILGSIYLTIALVSIVAVAHPEFMLGIALVLFPLQIIYKIISVPAIGSIKNPVAISNFIIAVLLITTWIISFI